jgi:hypothetical protein
MPNHPPVLQILSQSIVVFQCTLQVLDRLKAASAFLQLAQSLTKPSKAADTKLAKAAAKLAKVPHLSALQAQLHAAVEVAAQQCSTLKVCLAAIAALSPPVSVSSLYPEPALPLTCVHPVHACTCDVPAAVTCRHMSHAKRL